MSLHRAATLALVLSAVPDSSAFPFSMDFMTRRSSNSTLKTDLGYISPLDNGGKMLTDVPNTYPAGLGEPLNVIISANSDAEVLVDSSSNGGLRNYWLSLGMASECLGQHLGSDQEANLGDGHGALNETAVMRYDYGDPYLGTCTETVKGGNHFRYWVQDGSKANTGAIFMAVSYEQPATADHDIIPNGYNLGRDWLIGNATAQSIPTLDLTNTSTFTGSTVFNNYTYQTIVTYVSELLSNSSDGVNHYATVAVDGRPAIDGLVAVLEVHITKDPNGSTTPSGKNSGARTWPSLSLGLACTLVAVASMALW